MRVEAQHLFRHFGHTTVLRDVSFTLPPGTLSVLQGNNGAGKSTLLRMLALLLSPSAGTLLMDGAEPNASTMHSRIGFLSHDPMLYADLSGKENLEYFAALFGVSSADARVTAMAEQLQLTGFWNAPARTYSRGQLQRTAIARAMLHQPSLLLLDEPTGSLDTEACELFRSVLEQHINAGATALLITHDAQRFSDLAHQQLRLLGGRVVA